MIPDAMISTVLKLSTRKTGGLVDFKQTLPSHLKQLTRPSTDHFVNIG